MGAQTDFCWMITVGSCSLPMGSGLSSSILQIESMVWLIAFKNNSCEVLFFGASVPYFWNSSIILVYSLSLCLFEFDSFSGCSLYIWIGLRPDSKYPFFWTVWILIMNGREVVLTNCSCPLESGLRVRSAYSLLSLSNCGRTWFHDFRGHWRFLNLYFADDEHLQDIVILRIWEVFDIIVF